MNGQPRLIHILEAALLAAGGPLTIEQLRELFPEEERPDRAVLEAALEELGAEYGDRGIELLQVAGGYRIQVRATLAPWVGRLWEERPVRYSRALLETLALIAYRQPITRGEIEEVRGVAVSTHIIRTLLERDWVRVVGKRDVPGRPSLYATTRQFLDYFGLRSLSDLPPLAALQDLNALVPDLEPAKPDPSFHEGQADDPRHPAPETPTYPSPHGPH